MLLPLVSLSLRTNLKPRSQVSNIMSRYALLCTVLTVFQWAMSPPATGEDRFAGFPKINQFRPGDRSFEVITSDGVPGLVRPVWTRCISELGRNPRLFRLNDKIFVAYSHLDGHRNKRFEATGECRVLMSPDDGRTWESLPALPRVDVEFEFAVKGDTIYRYTFLDRKQTYVRTSKDGIKWSDATPVYKGPFWFWGVKYDKKTDAFWCAAHAIPGYGASKERQIHLITSRNGIDWKFVDQVVPYDNSSESILRFDDEGTMTIVIRRKYASIVNVAVGKPPYTDWSISSRPMIAEGQHFYDFGGKTFMTSRAVYQGKDERVLKNPHLYGSRRAYSLIYHMTPKREFVPWAIMDSMGDSSYACLLETREGVLCAYYSQHEDKVSKIFLSLYDRDQFLAGPKSQ